MRDAFAIIDLLPGDLLNVRYGVIVRGASAGFYRVQLTDLELPDRDSLGGHGAVVRELLTNDVEIMMIMVRTLRVASDPVACARLLEDEFKVRGPGGMPVLGEKEWRRIEKRA